MKTKVTTTHEFSKHGLCVGCGLMIKNSVKKPFCKVLRNGPKEITVEVTKKPVKTEFPDLHISHIFKNGWCQHCDVRSHSKAKFGSCAMTYKKAMAAPSKGGKIAPMAACHATHPVLKFGSLEIYGGSCNHPKVKGCDIYIGFDSGMRRTSNSAPWRRGEKGFVEEVFFKVTDFTAPADPKEFKRLVVWTIGQLQIGKKIHAGCIGGHGRTGLFLAAIAAMQNEVLIEDAIMYVRENYCKKAVESPAQIKFLETHFGVKTKATGSKSYTPMKKGTDRWINKNVKSMDEEADFYLDGGDDVIDPSVYDDIEAEAAALTEELSYGTKRPTRGVKTVWGSTLTNEDE